MNFKQKAQEHALEMIQSYRMLENMLNEIIESLPGEQNITNMTMAKVSKKIRATLKESGWVGAKYEMMIDCIQYAKQVEEQEKKEVKRMFAGIETIKCPQS